MGSLPTGTVTFLFTDIEGSTKLAQEHPDKWESLRERHHAILQSAMDAHNGYVFQIIGDAFCVAFHTASDAINAATDVQRKLQTEEWGETSVKVRMGIHTGEAQAHNNEYHGYLTMSLVQRIMSAGHGGQILLSNATENLLRGGSPKDITLRNMGEHKFKDFIQIVRVFQVVAPDLQSEFPALRALDAFPNNLPTQLTSFVGREKELADVKKLLADAHLLTLIGPGGTGKTRLSIQSASESLTRYSDGVWLIEFAPILDPFLVARTTAIAIGLREEPQRPVIDMLCDYLREKKMLLILDNCEHLVDACAQMANRILQAAPQVHILASSREALGVAGEVTYRVPSLGLPDINHLPPVESLSQYEAVKLFIDRATSAAPSFKITNDNAPFLAQICHRLDGIPLAIELAAARTKVLRLEQIAERLNNRFHLLTGGARTALPRQQTLRALIDWSYDLLSENEKIVLRRLSVFIGGWTLEAAEQVCSDEHIHLNDVLDLLTHLVEKSLVIVDEQPSQLRYRMLETIRQYSDEKLIDSDETVSLQNRHLEYYCHLAERLEPGLRGPNQVNLLDSLEMELDNLRAALEYAINHSMLAGLQLSSRLKWFWHLRSLWSEGISWLDKFTNKDDRASIDPASDARYRAEALLAFVHLAGVAGVEIPRIMASLTKCIALSEKLDDAIRTPILAESYHKLAGGALLAGDINQAQALADKSMGLFQLSGDKFGIAELQSDTLSIIALRSGDMLKAKHFTESALDIRRELGDKDGIAFGLGNSGLIEYGLENFDQAINLFKATIEASQEARNNYLRQTAFGNLGVIYLFKGELDIAEENLLRAAELAQAEWNPVYKSTCIFWLTIYSFEKKRFRKCVQLNSYLETEKSHHIYLYFLPPSIQMRIQAMIDTARTQLDEASFDKARIEGKAMTLDQAFAYALEGIDE